MKTFNQLKAEVIKTPEGEKIYKRELAKNLRKLPKNFGKMKDGSEFGEQRCLCSKLKCDDPHCLCSYHYLSRKDYIDHLTKELSRIPPRPKSLIRKLLNEIVK